MTYLSNSMSEAVRDVIDMYPMNHEFGLWDLKRDVTKRYPPSKKNHADTVSRRMREFRVRNGYEILCINRNKSRYKKVAFVLNREKDSKSEAGTLI